MFSHLWQGNRVALLLGHADGVRCVLQVATASLDFLA